MQKSLGWIMLLAGIFLLFVGFVFPMVILYADDTPPTWLLAADGTVSLAPRDGDVLSSSTMVQVGVNDPESGVASVLAWIDSVQYDLTLKVGTPFSGIWQKSIPAVATGTHTIKYTAMNKVGLSTTYAGSFQIYTALQGKWYVNNVEITSPTQEVYSASLSISFKFVKTTGIADASITCTLWEGTTKLATLTNTATNTWMGSYTFTTGKHTLNLKASDGTGTIEMNIFSFYVGDKPFELPTLNIMQILGLASAGIGLVLIFTGKKH